MDRLEFVHQQFGLQQAQCDDPSSLVNYLLKAAPLYARLCAGDISVTDEDIQDCLGFAMPEEPETGPKLRTELTAFGCPCSKQAHVCVDTELACLRCMSCGRMTGTGFVRPSTFQDLSLCNTSRPYVYQPKSFLGKHLIRLQGQGYPRLPPEMLNAIRHDLTARGVSLSTAMPNDVYASLKRLKLGDFYPHRWALTKRVNPTYQPLSLSHELCERLQCMFVTCHARYASQRSKTGRKRKFLPYQFFILHALQYLGEKENIEVHFKPLKNKALARQYALDVQYLLRGIRL